MALIRCNSAGEAVDMLVAPMKYLIFSSADGYQTISDIVPGTAITGNITARSLVAIFNVTGFNGTLSGSHPSLQQFVMGVKDGVMTPITISESFSNVDVSAYDYIIFDVASGQGVGAYSFTFTAAV